METFGKQSKPEPAGIIYVNDRPLIVTDNAGNYRVQHPEAADYPLFKSADPDRLHEVVQQLESGGEAGILMEYPDISRFNEALKAAFRQIDAAGGLVTDPDGNLLMIYRNGKWDLPKGKVDRDEAIPRAAVREVLEETGLPGVRLSAPLSTSQHIYKYENRYVLKTTFWFLMKADASYPLYPQAEEGITQAEWSPPGRLRLNLKNTYETIRDVVRKAGLL